MTAPDEWVFRANLAERPRCKLYKEPGAPRKIPVNKDRCKAFTSRNLRSSPGRAHARLSPRHTSCSAERATRCRTRPYSDPLRFQVVGKSMTSLKGWLCGGLGWA